MIWLSDVYSKALSKISSVASKLYPPFEPYEQIRDDHNLVPKAQSYSSLSAQDRAKYAEKNGKRIVEDYKEFLIGHIEFNDQGKFWDKEQLDTVEKTLRLNAKNMAYDGVTMVVLVHGWKHNAKHDDENLCSFRKLLADLAQTEGKLAPQRKILNSNNSATPRRIVGIYPSWRGLNIRTPGINNVTFLNRKKTAHRVGRGSLVETLVKLEQICYCISTKEKSTLIIVGHSFGAAAVYSAVSHYIKADAYEKEFEHDLTSKPIRVMRGFGDLVVLVNPAFEALLYDDFDKLAKRIRTYNGYQYFVLMTVSSESDVDTKKWFPRGQKFFRKLEHHTDKEFEKIISTSGNYAPYITHRLSVKSNAANQLSNSIQTWVVPAMGNTAKPSPPTPPWVWYAPTNRRWDIVEESKNLPGDSSGLKWPSWPSNLPFMMVRSDGELISDHNDIFQPRFAEYLRDFVIAQDLQKAHAQKAQAQPQNLPNTSKTNPGSSKSKGTP